PPRRRQCRRASACTAACRRRRSRDPRRSSRATAPVASVYSWSAREVPVAAPARMRRLPCLRAGRPARFAACASWRRSKRERSLAPEHAYQQANDEPRTAEQERHAIETREDETDDGESAQRHHDVAQRTRAFAATQPEIRRHRKIEQQECG